MLGLGASFGLMCVAARSGKVKILHLRLDGGLAALAGALIGGRIYFAIEDWLYFQSHPLEILQLWLGGFSWPGALAGGILGLGVFAFLSRNSLSDLADGLLPILPPLVISAWLASWANGVAYGAPAPGAWWAVPGRDEWGRMALRVPVQPLGALVSLGLFYALDQIQPKLRRTGQAASLALLALALQLFAFSFLRADAARTWLGWRWDAWAGLGFTLLGGIFLMLTLFRRDRVI